MNKEIEKYLNKFQRPTKYGMLDAMEFLMQKLGNPQAKCKIIHIAGTNRKGECA